MYEAHPKKPEANRNKNDVYEIVIAKIIQAKIKSRLKNNYNVIIVKCNYMHSHEDDFEFIIIRR